jgi:hypothetical protein
MFTNELIRLFPRKRIKAIDGMAVTADVWEEAHEYHRQLVRFHSLLQHGYGIVAGLDVIASEPADSSVYVLAGLAVDSLGQAISLSEPRAYDLSTIEGTVYLILTYTESRPVPSNGKAQEDAPMYVHSQYSLEVVKEFPNTPYVELARIRNRRAQAPVTVAADPQHPKANELDLRFRRHTGVQPVEPIAVGVATLQGADSGGHDEGIALLAAALRQGGQQVWVDQAVPLVGDLSRYTILFLMGRDTVAFTSDEMSAIYSFLQQGGTLFYESCRRGGVGEPAADGAFVEMVSSFGLQLQNVTLGHKLLQQPNLFGAPPDGYETRGQPKLQIAEGIIFSTYDYGCIWRAERRDRTASRSEIRNAIEFGANIVAYAVARQQLAQQQPSTTSTT